MQTHSALYLIWTNFAIKSREMKNQKLLYYVFKWLALAFLSYLLLCDTISKTGTFVLIGFVAVLLIWQGIRDFGPKNKQTEK